MARTIITEEDLYPVKKSRDYIPLIETVIFIVAVIIGLYTLHLFTFLIGAMLIRYFLELANFLNYPSENRKHLDTIAKWKRPSLKDWEDHTWHCHHTYYEMYDIPRKMQSRRSRGHRFQFGYRHLVHWTIVMILILFAIIFE